VVVRRGQIRRIGWVIKTTEAQVGQFLVGCKCPVRRGVVVQEQHPLGDLPAAFFLFLHYLINGTIFEKMSPNIKYVF